MKNTDLPGTARSTPEAAQPIAPRDARGKRFFVRTRVKAGPHMGTLSGVNYDWYGNGEH